MLIKKAEKTIREYGLIAKGDKVLIGVSGGPDSVTLLYLLGKFRKGLGLTLHIAHLDHQLRKDSYRDRQFVEKLAKQFKIPITVSKVDIRKLAKLGSVEETARNARLEFFFRVAKKIKADKIALGHNLDDQAETVLMRILRGSGLYGLAGILAKREINGFTIIRPLIEISRREIEKFLSRKNIRHCIDSTNSEDIYFRNKIRNSLLPFLEKNYNPNIKEVLNNLAQTSACDYDYLNRTAGKFFRKKKIALDLNKLKSLHPAILRLVLRLGLARVKGNMRRITFKHIKELEDLIYNRPPKSVVDLPHGTSAIKTPKNLFLFFEKA